MKKILCVTISILALSPFLLGAPQADAATLNVPGSYATIQAAINAAAAGDTVIVQPGTYTSAITLNKAITLQAATYDTANPRNNTTIIDGNNAGAVVTIPSGVSNTPKIVGFVLRNAGSGVLANSIFTIEYSHLTDGDDLAEYETGSGGVNRNNVYTLAGDDCIDLDNQNKDVLIENNLCINPPDDSIEMRFQDDSLPNTITVTVRGNRLEGSGGDGFQFIDYNTDTKRRVILERNLFLNNKKAGIGFLCCTKTSNDLSAHPMREEARILNNTFVGNANGVTGGGNALVLNNIFLNTTGIALKNVTGASYISHNLFSGNGINSSGTTNNSPILGSPLLNTSYVPQAGSPAIDAGLASFTWNSLFGTFSFSIPSTEYSGNGPDIGWKETGLTAPTPTAGPSPTPLLTNTPAPPTPTPLGGNQVTLVVAANSDDAEEDLTTGAVDLVSTDLEFISDGSAVQTVGMRFDSVAIPKGATITSAYLEFTADEAHSETTNLTLFGEAIDNATTFTTGVNNISNRPKTTASVAWSSLPSWSIGNKYQTPDLKSIIQEVINRSGWQSGYALSIIVTGTGHRTAEAFDGDSANAAKLVVTYSTSSEPPPETCTFEPTSNTFITTTVDIPTTGTYRVWSRLRSADGQSNSYFLRIDDTCAIFDGGTPLEQNIWTWVDYQDGNPNQKIDLPLTAGPHVVTLIAKENEIDIDRLIFAADTSCMPSDTGDNCGQATTNTPIPPSVTPSLTQSPPSPTISNPTSTPKPTPPGQGRGKKKNNT
ncbi:MAG: right-handed parallel beta-helix repeat-containing protein [bacterium]|nr:right-handed parallel beta-helix repeat-containing protein [bacterium]